MQTYPGAIVIGDCIGLLTNGNMRIAAMQTRSEKGIPDFTFIYPSRGYAGLVIEMKKDGTVLKNKNGTWRKDGYKREYIKYGKKYIYTGDHIAEQVATLEKYNRLGFYGRFAIGRYQAKRLLDWYCENVQSEMF